MGGVYRVVPSRSSALVQLAEPLNGVGDGRCGRTREVVDLFLDNGPTQVEALQRADRRVADGLALVLVSGRKRCLAG